MMVVDEVGGSDEGELEDGEIEEEEGQITTHLAEDSERESRHETHVSKRLNSTLGDFTEFCQKTQNRQRETVKQSKSSESKSTRTSPPERNVSVDSKWKVGTKSASPKRRERERNRSVSASGKSRAQRRATEAVRRAARRRDRESPGPGRRASGTRTGSGVNTRSSIGSSRRRSRSQSRSRSRSRSRSPIRYQRSYRPPQLDSEGEVYEKLLRQHRSVQHKIREEQRRLSGSHGNKSNDKDRENTPRSRSRGWSKENTLSGKKSAAHHQEEEDEDEEMLLLQLRKDALASLAKEETEKGERSKDGGPDTNDSEIVAVSDAPVSPKDDETSTAVLEFGATAADISKDVADNRVETVVEEIVSTPSGDWVIEAVVSDGQYDNYEEVEMEVDEEEETTQKEASSSVESTLQEAVMERSTETKMASGPASGLLVKETGAGHEDDEDDEEDDDDDDKLMRAELLKSMLTKRAAKAKTSKVLVSGSGESTPVKPLSPLAPPTPPPASTPPSVSRSSSPVPTRLQQQGPSLAGQMQSRAKPPMIPVHQIQPVVISLVDDSDESEDESATGPSPFMGKLDSFLKEFRKSSNKSGTSTTVSDDRSHKPSKEVARSKPKTPEAMRTAPTPHRQEYHRLKAEIVRREQRKTAPSEPIVSKHEQKVPIIGGIPVRTSTQAPEPTVKEHEWKAPIIGGIPVRTSRQAPEPTVKEHELKAPIIGGIPVRTSRQAPEPTVKEHEQKAPIIGGIPVRTSTQAPEPTVKEHELKTASMGGIPKNSTFGSQSGEHSTSGSQSKDDPLTKGMSREGAGGMKIIIRQGSGKYRRVLKTVQGTQLDSDPSKKQVTALSANEKSHIQETLIFAQGSDVIANERLNTPTSSAITDKRNHSSRLQAVDVARLSEKNQKRVFEEKRKMKAENKRKAALKKKQELELYRRTKQINELERKRGRYRLMLKKDRGLYMQKDQQISRRTKYIQQAQEQLQYLTHQMAAMQNEIRRNEAHIIKHFNQKAVIEERIVKHLAFDDRARASLAELRSVPLSEVNLSEYASYLPKPGTVSLIGGKRKIENVAKSSDEKRPKMGIGPADLKKLQDLERELAEKIRNFREAEAQKASVSVVGKSVLPGSKVQLVRRLSANKPAEKIYSKDIIELRADSSANTDSEGEAVKGESSSVKGQGEARRKSWLDSNPTLTPNLRLPSKRSQPVSPSLADLGKVKAKFRAEGQRSGQSLGGQSSKSNETSVEGDLLQWIESSEGKSSPSSDVKDVRGDLIAGVKGSQTVKVSHLNRIKKMQKEKELKGIDFATIASNFASTASTNRDRLAPEWCKDTQQEVTDTSTNIEQTERSDQFLSLVKPGTQGHLAYRSPLLAFKAFRLSPLFRVNAGYSVQSHTFTNKLDSTRPLCQYELKGTCNDDDCPWQHEQDYTMSSREAITDLLSYNTVSKTQAESRAKTTKPSPVKGKHKSGSGDQDKLAACIESVLSGLDKGVVTQLISQPRKWRPRPRLRSKRLSSGDDDARAEILPLIPPKYPPQPPTGPTPATLRREVIRSAEEERRYYAQGQRSGEKVTELPSSRVGDLEAAVLDQSHHVGLWLQLAQKLLQESSVDRALNALSRGLEMNSGCSALWCQYLATYRQRADQAEYREMCLKATELAPCYQTWWELLEAETSVSSKLDVCGKILDYLKKSPSARNSETSTESKQSQSEEKPGFAGGEEIEPEAASQDTMGTTKNADFTRTAISSGEQSDSHSNDEDLAKSSREVKSMSEMSLSGQTGSSVKTGDAGAENSNGDSDCGVDNDGRTELAMGGSDPKSGEATKTEQTKEGCNPGNSQDRRDVGAMPSKEEVSHQVLEILLYRAQLRLNVGHRDMAIKELESVIAASGSEHQDKLTTIMVTFDLCLAWLSLLHIQVASSLPSSLFDPASHQPSRIVNKDNISLPWKTGRLDMDSAALRILCEKAWTVCSSHSLKHSYTSDSSGLCALRLARIDMEEELGSVETLDEVTHEVMSDCKNEAGGSELLHRCIQALLRKNAGEEDVALYVGFGVRHFPYTCRFHCLQAQLCLAQGSGSPEGPLRQCITSFYQLTREEGQQITGPSILQLYRHQLKLPIPLGFPIPVSSPAALAQLGAETQAYLWLNYILLTHSLLGQRMACQAFESALVSIQGTKQRQFIWLEYINYVSCQGRAPDGTLRDSDRLHKLVSRCLVTMTTQYPLPLDDSGRTWNDFSFHNRLIDVFLQALPEGERMEALENMQMRMPDNVWLAIRGCRYAVENGFHQLGLQIVFASLHRQPYCLTSWKIVIALALQSQRYSEVHQLYERAVLFHPLHATLWRDYLAFVIAHDVNHQKKLDELLRRCRELGFKQVDVFPVARS